MFALAFQVKALGVSDTTGDFRICKMIEGWGKERVKTPDDRPPFTPAILMRFSHMWADLCRDAYETSLFQAASLVTFFGACRISEVVAGGRSDKSQIFRCSVD